MAILTTKYNINMANAFINSVESGENSYYVYTAYSTEFSSGYAPSPDNSVANTQQNVYNDILYGKLITSSNIKNVVPRHTWTAGTVYARYDQNVNNLYSTNYYVVTNTYDVYKCINNNNGAPSTIQPSLKATSGTFVTGDGYVWKYMYTIDSISNSYFTSTNFIPVVPNTAVQNNAVTGTIDSFFVANGGSGYITETGLVQSFINAYSIQLPSTSSSLDNYYTGSSIYLNSGVGPGQIRQIQSYSGSTKKVIVSNQTPFLNYAYIELSNIQGANPVVGQTAYQAYDNINYVYPSGYINTGDTVIQTDTGITGYVIAANATYIDITKTSSGFDFSLNYPIVDTVSAGVLNSGTAIIYNNNTYVFASGFTANSVYPSGAYIRVGTNANTNVRRVVSSNTTVIITDIPFSVSVTNTASIIANSAYVVSNTIAISNANTNYYVGDYIYYSVPAGNTAIPGLTANSYYYVSFSNTTVLALASTRNGANLALTPATTNPGQVHSLLNYTNHAQNHYTIPNAIEPYSITDVYAEGSISQVNINSVTLSIANTIPILGSSFTIGESVIMVNSSNVAIGANGTVAYANSTSVILSNVLGSWTAGSGYYILGTSSELRSTISSVLTVPNITVSQPVGQFNSGQAVYFQTAGVSTGNATIIAETTVPNSLTQYTIAPTITVTGDGTNSVSLALVNTSVDAANSIYGTLTINPGIGYTYANVTVTANSSYGTGANLMPIIAPIGGHGGDAVTELGGFYCCISEIFTNTDPFYQYLSYNKLGILNTPSYTNVLVNINDFDRVKLTLTGSSGTFATNEIVISSSNGSSVPVSNAAGVCVYSNSTYLELKNVIGSFSNVSPNNVVYGLSSGTYANIALANVATFKINSTSGIEFISEVTSGASAYIDGVSANNTQLQLTNVVGRFDSNDVIVDATTNSYATIASIYTSNGLINATSSFGQTFNQTARLTITSNTAPFDLYETVLQSTTNASGKILSLTGEVDVSLSSVTGTFSNGQYVSTSSANGYIKYSNNSYLMITNVLGTFTPGATISTAVGASATISSTLPVLLLNNIDGPEPFQASAVSPLTITGLTSGSTGICNNANLILYPDLVRNSGTVIYYENLKNPVTITRTSQEQVQLVIQF